MKKTALLLFAISVVSSYTQAYAASEFTTPQYSGPGANTDGGMKSRVTPRMISRGPIQLPSNARGRLDDSATEKFITRRETQIHREMDRRRDEATRKIITND